MLINDLSLIRPLKLPPSVGDRRLAGAISAREAAGRTARIAFACAYPSFRGAYAFRIPEGETRRELKVYMTCRFPEPEGWIVKRGEVFIVQLEHARPGGLVGIDPNRNNIEVVAGERTPVPAMSPPAALALLVVMGAIGIFHIRRLVPARTRAS